MNPLPFTPDDPARLCRFADAAAIAATEAANRSRFLTAYWDAPIAEVWAALWQICRDGHGALMQPEAGLHHAGTHLIEITVFGASATGSDSDEVTRNWLRVARNLEVGDAA